MTNQHDTGSTLARPFNMLDLPGRATITVPQAAELLGLSPNSARKAVERGEIPVQRFGRRVVVPVPALMLRLLGVDDPMLALSRLDAQGIAALAGLMTNEGTPRGEGRASPLDGKPLASDAKHLQKASVP